MLIYILHSLIVITLQGRNYHPPHFVGKEGEVLKS